MNSQKDYWEKKIVPWEQSAFHEDRPSSSSLLERVAQVFRKTVQHRAAVALQVLNVVKPKVVLELGCGSGRFSRQVAGQAWAERVLGVDISDEAIALAKSQSSGPSGAKLTFTASSVSDLSFPAVPDFDFVVGLGLTPYLRDEEFDYLLRGMSGRGFFFDFHPSGLRFVNVAHAAYRAVKRHPFYLLYSDREIGDRVARFGYRNAILGRSHGVYFVCHPGVGNESQQMAIREVLLPVASLIG